MYINTIRKIHVAVMQSTTFADEDKVKPDNSDDHSKGNM